MIDKRWDELRPADWLAFAKAWLDELRDADRDVAGDNDSTSQRVVLMNFTAAPEHQWRFIVVAVDLAASDHELDHIAAGPIEHLLGWHGDKFIDQVEEKAASDEKFRRALASVRRYLMPEVVWLRVQALR